MIWWFCAPLEGALVALLQKMRFVGRNAAFFENKKTPASRTTSWLCQYKYGKECTFYIKMMYSNCQHEVFV